MLTGSTYLSAELNAAKAEIERLRAELKEFTELKEYAKSLDQETYLELHAKNERLRAFIRVAVKERWFDYDAAEKILNEQLTK